MQHPLTALVALALLAAACTSGAADPATPGSSVSNSNAAGACLAGDPNCEDILEPLPGEEPIEFDPNTGDPIVRGLPVSQVLDTQIDGGFAIRGFYYDDGDGPRLCETLAESFPPQCAGPAIPLDLNGNAPPDGAVTSQSVTWTDTEVEIIGHEDAIDDLADPAD